MDKILNILLAVLICAIMIAPAIAQPTTPFVISGDVFDSGGGPCNDPSVQITNTNTGDNWSATSSSGSNYYQLLLDSNDVSDGNVLEIEASGCSQWRTVEHTVEINAGGFTEDITLADGICCDCCQECGEGIPCEYSSDIHTQDACEAEHGLWLPGETDPAACEQYNCDGEGNCVPEVATIVLVAGGLLGVFGVMQRRREE